MPIKEVCSPISSHSPHRHHTPGSSPPVGPGSRTNPSRGDQSNEPPHEPTKAHVSLGEGGGEIHVTGPKELPHGAKPQERQSPEE
jgi:hypothetical protein